MVASAVALLIVAGVVKLFIEHLRGNQRLLLEARLHQDLRAATDLVARDLRRAGYWQQALAATSLPPKVNPYRIITPPAGGAAEATRYSFSRDDAENNAIDLAEDTGFRLAAGALQVLTGGSWQTLTDPGVLRITRFSVTPEVRTVPLGQLCTPVCAPGSAGCPTLQLRSYRIDVGGLAASDTAVMRDIVQRVRVRNDELVATACP